MQNKHHISTNQREPDMAIFIIDKGGFHSTKCHYGKRDYIMIRVINSSRVHNNPNIYQ